MKTFFYENFVPDENFVFDENYVYDRSFIVIKTSF